MTEKRPPHRKQWYTVQFSILLPPDLEQYQLDILKIGTALMGALEVEMIDGIMIYKLPKKPLRQRIKERFRPVVLLASQHDKHVHTSITKDRK